MRSADDRLACPGRISGFAPTGFKEWWDGDDQQAPPRLVSFLSAK